VPWSHCPNNNVFSDRLNWPYDSPICLRSGCIIIIIIIIRDLYSAYYRKKNIGSCEGPVSETAGRPFDRECSSIDRWCVVCVWYSRERTGSTEETSTVSVDDQVAGLLPSELHPQCCSSSCTDHLRDHRRCHGQHC